MVGKMIQRNSRVDVSRFFFGLLRGSAPVSSPPRPEFRSHSAATRTIALLVSAIGVMNVLTAKRSAKKEIQAMSPRWPAYNPENPLNSANNGTTLYAHDWKNSASGPAR